MCGRGVRPVGRKEIAVLLDDYGLIGDLESAALVGRNAAIDWLCLPRFDSGSCLSALLGDVERQWFCPRSVAVAAPNLAGTCDA
jgi:hypothetical protein